MSQDKLSFLVELELKCQQAVEHEENIKAEINQLYLSNERMFEIEEEMKELKQEHRTLKREVNKRNKDRMLELKQSKKDRKIAQEEFKNEVKQTLKEDDQKSIQFERKDLHTQEPSGVYVQLSLFSKEDIAVEVLT